MHPSITADQHLWLLIMQLEVSAWQDGRDCSEDYPEMSKRTEAYRDQLLKLVNGLIAGKDHRDFPLIQDAPAGSRQP